jgi:hypothetical protein
VMQLQEEARGVMYPLRRDRLGMNLAVHGSAAAVSG